MFSYTDDAIVTSSPTGRHLSTIIRRPAAIGPLDWNEHADQVCKVLNELDSKAKAGSLSLHMQVSGRIYRLLPNGRSEILAELRSGPSFAELIDQGYLSPLSFGAVPPAGPTPATARIAELEKQLDDVTTKLAAAQMLLEKPIEVTAELGASLYYLPKGCTTTHSNRTFKRVE